MFHNTDSYASVESRHLKIGDTFRQIGYCGKHKPVTMMVIAFPGDRDFRHCVWVKRLDNGQLLKVSQFWIAEECLNNPDNRYEGVIFRGGAWQVYDRTLKRRRPLLPGSVVKVVGNGN